MAEATNQDSDNSSQVESTEVKATTTQKTFSQEDVDAVFTRNLPSNDYETSQMITNLDGIVDRELLASQLSFVKDASKTVEAAKQESDKSLKDDEYAANDYPDHNALDSASNSPNG